MHKHTFTTIVRGLVFSALMLLWTSANTQDIHYSQFNYTPTNINPALTGVFQGDQRFTGNFRTQWYTVPVSYLTFTGAYDFKIYDKNLLNTLFAGGLTLNYDRGGYSALSLAQVGLSSSVTQRLTKKNFLSLGLKVDFNQRWFEQDNLSFGQQWNGEEVDLSRSTGENFDEFRHAFFTLGVGLNWHHQIPKKRTRYDLGIAYYNLNQPSISFLGDNNSMLFGRFSLYGLASVKVAEPLNIIVKASAQRQGKATEVIPAAAIRIYIDPDPARTLAFQLGGGYRFSELGDAFYPEVHVFFGPWSLGLSYDVNVSEFERATQNVGAVEASVSYIFTKVRPVPLKICPLF